MATLIKDEQTLPKAQILRLSITGECNLNCFYCRPMGKFKDLIKPAKLIVPSDVTKLVKIMGELGVRRVHISGGEPLLRKDAASFVKSANAHKAIEEVLLVTNGTFLKSYADALRKYGLRKVDINFDSLSFLKFQKITGTDSLYRVLDGVEKAERLNYLDVRINIFLLEGINDDEVVNFARLIKDRKLHIRFIQYHPAINAADPYANRKKLTVVRAKQMIDNYQTLIKTSTNDNLDGAVQIPSYSFDGSIGQISFVGPEEMTLLREVPKVLFTPEGALVNETSGKTMDVLEMLRKDAKDVNLHRAIEKFIVVEEKKKSQEMLNGMEAAKPSSHKAAANKKAAARSSSKTLPSVNTATGKRGSVRQATA